LGKPEKVWENDSVKIFFDYSNKEAISADMKIGFFAMLNDMVKECRNMFDSDATSNTPAKFGYITLSGDKVTGVVKKVTTADMSIVMTDVAIASGAVLVFKKRK